MGSTPYPLTGKTSGQRTGSLPPADRALPPTQQVNTVEGYSLQSGEKEGEGEGWRERERGRSYFGRCERGERSFRGEPKQMSRERRLKKHCPPSDRRPSQAESSGSSSCFTQARPGEGEEKKKRLPKWALVTPHLFSVNFSPPDFPLLKLCSNQLMLVLRCWSCEIGDNFSFNSIFS